MHRGEERVRMGNNHRRKNRHLISGGVYDGCGGGGNGIAGLVMFGGALVVTGFIAVVTSAINKNRTKDVVNEPNPKPKPQQQQSLDSGCKSQEDREIETTQGLRALLEPSTTPTNDAEAASVSHGATDTKSIHNTCIPVMTHSSSFATEEKIDPVPDLNNINEVVQKIVLSDDSNPESAIEEECLAPLFNTQGVSQSQAQDVELEPQEKESLKSIEQETQDDGVVSESGEEEVVQEIVFSDDSHSESAASSHDSVIQEECLASLFNSVGSQAQNVELELEPQESLKPKETEKQDDDDVVSEIAEEKGSSKAMLNSNEKPFFCPAQEDFNFKGEGGKIDFQNKEHEAAKTIYYSAASRSFQMTMWLMPMLLPGLLLLLLLLLLIYGTQQFFVLQ